MKPYILNLREERCPMALLRAKREHANSGGRGFIILIRDLSSMSDIVRFFEKHDIVVHVEERQDHYVLTVNNKRSYLDV